MSIHLRTDESPQGASFTARSKAYPFVFTPAEIALAEKVAIPHEFYFEYSDCPVQCNATHFRSQSDAHDAIVKLFREANEDVSPVFDEISFRYLAQLALDDLNAKNILDVLEYDEAFDYEVASQHLTRILYAMNHKRNYVWGDNRPSRVQSILSDETVDFFMLMLAKGGLVELDVVTTFSYRDYEDPNAKDKPRSIRVCWKTEEDTSFRHKPVYLLAELTQKGKTYAQAEADQQERNPIARSTVRNYWNNSQDFESFNERTRSIAQALEDGSLTTGAIYTRLLTLQEHKHYAPPVVSELAELWGVSRSTAVATANKFVAAKILEPTYRRDKCAKAFTVHNDELEKAKGLSFAAQEVK